MIHRELAKAKPVILVIDDDPAVRNSLKFALEIEGFSVRLYPTGAALLDEQAMPESGCLVTDYHLPGMNGLDLLTQLRERNVSFASHHDYYSSERGHSSPSSVGGCACNRKAAAERYAI
jgi:CheY-like chemotaxis protein